VRRLAPQDFKLESIDEGAYKYFSYFTNKYELTIEPRAFGFDVALYDKDGILKLPKIAVVSGESEKFTDAFERAVVQANLLWNARMGENYARD
jgi:hypothetical protein